MSGRATLFWFVAALALAAWMNGGIVSLPPAAQAARAEVRLFNDRVVALRKVDNVIWAGDGLPGGVMAVYCGAGGIAIGVVNRRALALNGTTMTLARGREPIGIGTSGPIIATNLPEMVEAGLVAAGAAPDAANRRLAEGRDGALKACN
jgi:hypothetical protein